MRFWDGKVREEIKSILIKNGHLNSETLIEITAWNFTFIIRSHVDVH